MDPGTAREAKMRILRAQVVIWKSLTMMESLMASACPETETQCLGEHQVSSALPGSLRTYFVLQLFLCPRLHWSCYSSPELPSLLFTVWYIDWSPCRLGKFTLMEPALRLDNQYRYCINFSCKDVNKPLCTPDRMLVR